MPHANRATLWRTNCQLRPIQCPGEPGHRGLRMQWISPSLRAPFDVCVKHIASHGGCFLAVFKFRANQLCAFECKERIIWQKSCTPRRINICRIANDYLTQTIRNYQLTKDNNYVIMCQSSLDLCN